VLEQNNYLQSLVPMILNSNTFKNKPSALYITWDEGAACPSPGQTFPTCTDPVATIWAGPTVRQGYQSSIAYSHYNFIPTLESLWNLTPLPIPASVKAPPMLDFFPQPSLLSVIEGTNNALFSNLFSSGSWGSWQSIGGDSASVPAVCSSGPSSLELIVRGLDGAIYHKTFSGGTWSSSWDSLGGATLNGPSCAVLNGVLYVAVTGVDGALWYNWMQLPSGSWSGWKSLLGASPMSPVLVASSSQGRLDLLVVGTHQEIWHKSFSNGVWSASWDTPGGTTSGVPAAVSDGSSLHIVVKGTNNGLFYNRLAFGGSWSGWVNLNGDTQSDLALSIDSSLTIHLVVRGLDSGIYHKSMAAGGAWASTWDSPGGVTHSTPYLFSVGSREVLVVTGSFESIFYNVLDATSWSGWVQLNGSMSSARALQIIL
jgi:hypothetical protein